MNTIKTIGLIAVTSLASSRTYFDVINMTVQNALGGTHTVRCITYHVDFYDIERFLAADRWDELLEIAVCAAVSLEKAGADFLVLTTTAMHRLIPEVRKAVRIPILHIVDVTADELVDGGFETVGLLGTCHTMTLDFYKDALRAREIEVLVPPTEDRGLLNSIIFDELCRGVVRDKSKKEVYRMIDELCGRGAEGIVLACTELCLLVKQTETEAALFDTTIIHAERAAKYALGIEYEGGCES